MKSLMSAAVATAALMTLLGTPSLFGGGTEVELEAESELGASGDYLDEDAFAGFTPEV